MSSASMSTASSSVRLVSDSALPAGVRVTQLQPALGSIVSGFRFDGQPPGDEAELEAALKAAGARTGDEIEIGDELLELQ